MASLGTLVTTFTANTGSLIAGIGKATAAVAAFSTAIGAVSFAGWSLFLAAEAEQLEMQFDVLTGKGEKVFRDIEKFAVTTSFSLESAGEAARAMLASGVGQPELINTMRILGDLAMGDGERMKLLAKAYTDVMNKQKLQAQELRQFSENGVGLVSELARMYGKTAGEIMKMSEQGQIGFDDMRRALERLTGEGGRFNNMMQKMSETTRGRFETLKENIAIMARTIADQVLPAINDVLKQTNDFLDVISGSTDRWQTMKDVFLATWELVLTTAKFKWDEWASDLGSILFNAIKGGLEAFDPMKIGFDLVGQANNQAFRDMEHAQLKFNHLMETLRNEQRKNAAQGGAVPGMPNNLEGVRAQLQQFAQLNNAQRIAMFGGQQEAIDRQQALREQMRMLKQQEAQKNLGGIFENLLGRGQQMAFGAQQFGMGLMHQGNWIVKTFQNAFDGTWMTKKQPQDQFAAAMTKGSVEAYSFIANAQKSGKDPQTNAIKEQTKMVIKKLDELVKKNPIAMKVVEAFAL